MAKFILFLIRFFNLYLYFVVMACFLSFIPNINPNYPLFGFIFKFSGFYIIPPVFGMIISPMLILIILTLSIIGLTKLYDKYYAKEEPTVIVMSPEEFTQKLEEFNKEKSKREEERKENEQ
jgi:hypothetical protein